MKKHKIIIYPVIIALLSTFIWSCNEKDDYILGSEYAFINVLQPVSKTLNIDYKAGESFCIVKSNATWQAKSNQSWLTCQTTSGEFGDTLRFSTTENPGGARSAYIVMHTTVANRYYDTLTIVQAHAPQFKPDGYTLTLNSNIPTLLPSAFSEELAFEVNASAAWETFCQPNDNWITLLTKEGDNNGKVFFSVKDNDCLENRQAYIYVTFKEFNNVRDSLLITQTARPKHIIITTPRSKTIMLDEKASSFSFVAEGDGAWKVTSKPQSWLTFDKTEFTDQASVKANVTETNTLRETEIYVSLIDHPEITDTLKVTQNVIPEGRLKDSLALVALYYATNGQNWEGPWKLELPLEQWSGIFLDNDRVIDISLGSRNLEGTLPEELGWLTEIIKIKFYSNKLTGPIPTSFNKLTKLTHIFMSKNKLNGQIPDLSALHDLEHFDLNFNRIEGFIPAELTTLPKLKYIMLQYNQLDPNGCIPGKFAIWDIYVNPQRAVYGDASSDYRLSACE